MAFSKPEFDVVFQVMDDRWDERVKEYGAINITGFRIIDTERPIVQQFFRTWEALDPAIYPGAGKPFIPVKNNTVYSVKYRLTGRALFTRNTAVTKYFGERFILSIL
jgi:hypothetical protein